MYKFDKLVSRGGPEIPPSRSACACHKEVNVNSIQLKFEMIKGPHTFGKCFAYKPKFIQGVHICVYSFRDMEF